MEKGDVSSFPSFQLTVLEVELGKCSGQANLLSDPLQACSPSEMLEMEDKRDVYLALVACAVVSFPMAFSAFLANVGDSQCLLLAVSQMLSLDPFRGRGVISIA